MLFILKQIKRNEKQLMPISQKEDVVHRFVRFFAFYAFFIKITQQII